jgi:hypothetical protein
LESAPVHLAGRRARASERAVIQGSLVGERRHSYAMSCRRRRARARGRAPGGCIKCNEVGAAVAWFSFFTCHCQGNWF